MGYEKWGTGCFCLSTSVETVPLIVYNMLDMHCTHIFKTQNTIILAKCPNLDKEKQQSSIHTCRLESGDRCGSTCRLDLSAAIAKVAYVLPSLPIFKSICSFALPGLACRVGGGGPSFEQLSCVSL